MAADTPPPEPDRVAGLPHPRETPRLFGQSEAEAAFLSAWAEDRIHHAWLLRGPQGVGKATLAYRIARALIEQGPTGEVGLFGGGDPAPASLDTPADSPVRARIIAGSEPRLTVLRRRANPKTGNLFTVIRVDEVREIREFLGLTAADGGWRAVIVDAADEMNPQAANALLKVLEEPPARTAMLLVSHSPARLLPTIRSRCRTLDLKPLAPVDLAAALGQAGTPVPADQAEAVATLAGGSVGKALRLVAGDGVALYARLVEALGNGRAVDRAAMVALADAASGPRAEATYALTVELTLLLVGRLARAAATGTAGPATVPAEERLAANAARAPAQAPLWAEAAGRIAAATSHARAVNLDPGQTIMDTFLDLDATLARVATAA